MSAAEHLHAVDDIEDDLELFLMGDEPEWDAPPPETGDVDQVNQWLRRLGRLDRREAGLVAQANTEIARIQLWLTLQLQPIEKERDWLQTGLTQYHRARLAREPKSKSIALPAGKLTSRKQQPEWEYVDEAAFLAWAEKNKPELVRAVDTTDEDALLEWAHAHVPPPAPDKTAVKQALTIPDGKPGDKVQPHLDGEVVPGITVTIREPRFDIELEGGES